MEFQTMLITQIDTFHGADQSECKNLWKQIKAKTSESTSYHFIDQVEHNKDICVAKSFVYIAVKKLNE